MYRLQLIWYKGNYDYMIKKNIDIYLYNYLFIFTSEHIPKSLAHFGGQFCCQSIAKLTYPNTHIHCSSLTQKICFWGVCFYRCVCSPDKSCVSFVRSEVLCPLWPYLKQQLSLESEGQDWASWKGQKRKHVSLLKRTHINAHKITKTNIFYSKIVHSLPHI